MNAIINNGIVVLDPLKEYKIDSIPTRVLKRIDKDGFWILKCERTSYGDMNWYPIRNYKGTGLTSLRKGYIITVRIPGFKEEFLSYWSEEMYNKYLASCD